MGCKDVIESKYRHDFVTCSCGNISVDGGNDYFKRSWLPGTKYEELNNDGSVCPREGVTPEDST